LEDAIGIAMTENTELRRRESQFSESRGDFSVTVERLERQHRNTEERLSSRLRGGECERAALKAQLIGENERFGNSRAHSELARRFKELELRLRQKDRGVFDLEKAVERVRERSRCIELTCAAHREEAERVTTDMSRQVTALRVGSSALSESVGVERTDLLMRVARAERKQERLRAKLSKLARYAQNLQSLLESAEKKKGALDAALADANEKLRDSTERAAETEDRALVTEHVFRSLSKKLHDLGVERDKLREACSGQTTASDHLRSELAKRERDAGELRDTVDALRSERKECEARIRERDTAAAEASARLEASEV